MNDFEIISKEYQSSTNDVFAQLKSNLNKNIKLEILKNLFKMLHIERYYCIIYLLIWVYVCKLH